MLETSCPECREPVSLLAPACRYCGAPNSARRTLTIAAAAVGAVVIAAVVALVVVLRGEGTGPDGQAVDQRASTGGDFAWLSKAMDDCDVDAKKQPDVLHFMVVPVVDDPKDEAGWRLISLNEVGNAILLSAENTIAGLKRGALKITKDEYVLAVRDEATNVVLRWSPSSGVKRFSTKDANGFADFKVQFQTRDGAGGANWGATFQRQPGICYWVNAIIRH